jgi:hypothetical protein
MLLTVVGGLQLRALTAAAPAPTLRFTPGNGTIIHVTGSTVVVSVSAQSTAGLHVLILTEGLQSSRVILNGAHTGSTQLSFTPASHRPGNYTFSAFAIDVNGKETSGSIVLRLSN